MDYLLFGKTSFFVNFGDGEPYINAGKLYFVWQSEDVDGPAIIAFASVELNTGRLRFNDQVFLHSRMVFIQIKLYPAIQVFRTSGEDFHHQARILERNGIFI